MQKQALMNGLIRLGDLPFGGSLIQSAPLMPASAILSVLHSKQAQNGSFGIERGITIDPAQREPAPCSL